MISKILVPPGGWKYQHGEFWIYGDTFDDLAKWVKSHRISNHLPIGNVEEDIEKQLKERNPNFEKTSIKFVSNGRNNV